MKVHKDWDAFLAEVKPDTSRMYAMTTHGSSPFAQCSFQPGDVFVFGSETSGLPMALRESFPGAAHPPADASRQPQHEFVEHRGRGRVRSLAPERLRRRRLKLSCWRARMQQPSPPRRRSARRSRTVPADAAPDAGTRNRTAAQTGFQTAAVGPIA
jgi:hypothetical protein